MLSTWLIAPWTESLYCWPFQSHQKEHLNQDIKLIPFFNITTCVTTYDTKPLFWLWNFNVLVFSKLLNTSYCTRTYSMSINTRNFELLFPSNFVFYVVLTSLAVFLRTLSVVKRNAIGKNAPVCWEKCNLHQKSKYLYLYLQLFIL